MTYQGLVLTQPQPPPTPEPSGGPGGRGDEFGQSSPLALVLILLFFVAVALLVRSMNKHLRKVPESFDPPPGHPREDTDPSDSPER